MTHYLRSVAFVVAIVSLGCTVAACSRIGGSSSTEASQDSDSSSAVLAKADELLEAKHGPTATQMAGNANKWRESYVHFPCKIINVVNGPAANATCGRGVTATFTSSVPAIPNVDYSDPNAYRSALNRAIKQSERGAERQMAVMQDQAMVVLVGDKVANFDGGQIVTITGQVLGDQQGRNAMGMTLSYPTVRVDYAE